MGWTVYNSDGKILQSAELGDNAVTTAKILDDAVTVGKLANSINTDIDANTAKTGITSGQAGAITANTAKVTNATHTGDVTGATALTIATGAVDMAMLATTAGTAGSGTFLRGDGQWQAAGGTAPTFGRFQRTAGNLTTTSTSLEDVSGAVVTITTGAFPVAYGLVASARSNTAQMNIPFNVDIDGSLELGSAGVTQRSVSNVEQNRSFTGQSVALSAAQHVIQLQWKNGGTGTTYLDANSSQGMMFWAHEIR